MPKKRQPRPFKLPAETGVAFLAPALTAGISGLATHQTGLAVAAVTSIGLTSAVVAAITGAIHRRRATVRRPRRRLLRSLSVGLTAGVVAGAVGFLASGWMPRLLIDLPLSAVLAATIITWRWHGSSPSVSASAAAPTRNASSNRGDFA